MIKYLSALLLMSGDGNHRSFFEVAGAYAVFHSQFPGRIILSRVIMALPPGESASAAGQNSQRQRTDQQRFL